MMGRLLRKCKDKKRSEIIASRLRSRDRESVVVFITPVNHCE
jgi:hypothetical protein